MLVEKVQIAGGGITGFAAGVALRDRGVEVEIHERFDELQGRATGFSIWAYAIKRLMEWGSDRGDSTRSAVRSSSPTPSTARAGRC